MPRLYMVRHGQTLFNALRRKQGWCDSPLTELGIEQVKATGAYFEEHGITFDHAYSSPSERACDTLEIVAPGMPYERVKGLKEWFFGTFEGVTEDVSPRGAHGDFYVPYGGESEEEFKERIFDTLTQIMRRPGHENVLVSTHGAVMTRFPETWGFNLREHLGVFGLGNGAFTVYEFDEKDGFTFVEAVDPYALTHAGEQAAPHPDSWQPPRVPHEPVNDANPTAAT